MPAYAPGGLTLAGEMVGEEFLRGLMVYGVPVGTPEYITHKLREVAGKIVADAQKTREVLGDDRQALWCALRMSISQRFGYLQQHTPPSLSRPVAAELDSALWQVLEASAGFQIPRGEEEGGLTLKVPAVPSLDNRSFQEWAVRLPARLYGWGFRSLADTCGPAWLGMLETALPFMAGRARSAHSLGMYGEGRSAGERWLQNKTGGARFSALDALREKSFTECGSHFTGRHSSQQPGLEKRCQQSCQLHSRVWGMAR